MSSIHSIAIVPLDQAISRPKAILFDWDNTLVDTESMIFEAFNAARVGVGLAPFDEETYSVLPHYSLKDAGAKIFGDKYKDAEKIFYNHIEKFHLEKLEFLEGASELLSYLAQQDIYLGVVSNKNGVLLRREVQHLKATHYFRKIIGSRDTISDKPSIVPVKEALSEADFSTMADVWFVGDSIVDVDCARSSGCIPFVVGYGEASQQSDVFHVENCQGLKQFLINL